MKIMNYMKHKNLKAAGRERRRRRRKVFGDRESGKKKDESIRDVKERKSLNGCWK